MAEVATARAQGLRVFLSYARADGTALADELFAGLELLGFEPMLDRHDIAAAEDWEQRLDGLIRQCDTVLFLLSPQAVSSPRCRWEVDHALALSKRIVPVVAVPVPEAEVPDALRRLNYVFFDAGRSFARSLGQLADALRLDLDWIRDHTRIAELATRWRLRGHDESLLLRGAELTAALTWKQGWRAGAPEVSAEQRAFIDSAAEAEARRADVERQRNEQMVQANASRAEALATREAALRRLRRLTIGGGLVGFGLSSGLAFTGWRAWKAQQGLIDARAAEATAKARALEEAIEREAMRTDIVGQVTAFAASPGEMAWDDSGFTPKLVEQLDQQRASLWAALQQVSLHVLAKTQGKQRPYIASDLNGDLWYRRSPPSRRRRALLVSLDQVASLKLPGVPRDAEWWQRFFEACGIPVQVLRNARRDEMLSALHAVQSAGSSQDAAPKAEPNTFLTFVYIGMGHRIDGHDCLGAVDSRPDDADRDAALRSTVRVSDVAATLRTHASASCMVLDTMFHESRRWAK